MSSVNPSNSNYQMLSDPASEVVPVNLASDTQLAANCRGLLVLTSGNVAIQTIDGAAAKVVLSGVPVGILPIRCQTVYSTGNGTTASNVYALY